MFAAAVAGQAGGYPAADSLVVTSFPLLGRVLDSMHKHAGGLWEVNIAGTYSFQTLLRVSKMLFWLVDLVCV